MECSPVGFGASSGPLKIAGFARFVLLGGDVRCPQATGTVRSWTGICHPGKRAGGAAGWVRFLWSLAMGFVVDLIAPKVFRMLA
jgi:hypothetical protein